MADQNQPTPAQLAAFERGCETGQSVRTRFISNGKASGDVCTYWQGLLLDVLGAMTVQIGPANSLSVIEHIQKFHRDAVKGMVH